MCKGQHSRLKVYFQANLSNLLLVMRNAINVWSLLKQYFERLVAASGAVQMVTVVTAVTQQEAQLP